MLQVTRGALIDVRTSASRRDCSRNQTGATRKNLLEIDTWLGKAAAAGAKLVLFQELSLTGFIPNHPMGNHEEWLRKALSIARRSAVTIPGKSPVLSQKWHENMISGFLSAFLKMPAT
ncbi:MAG: hypothetical protein R3C11_07430 [Planctomycetaceae bacterium]